MKTSILISALVLSVLPLAPPAGGSAQEAVIVVQLMFSGRISAIDSKRKEITLGDPERDPQTVLVGARTRIVRGEKNAVWSDLKLGMEVEGMFVSDEGSEADLLVIRD